MTRAFEESIQEVFSRYVTVLDTSTTRQGYRVVLGDPSVSRESVETILTEEFENVSFDDISIDYGTYQGKTVRIVSLSVAE